MYPQNSLARIPHTNTNTNSLVPPFSHLHEKVFLDTSGLKFSSLCMWVPTPVCLLSLLLYPLSLCMIRYDTCVRLAFPSSDPPVPVPMNFSVVVMHLLFLFVFFKWSCGLCIGFVGICTVYGSRLNRRCVHCCGLVTNVLFVLTLGVRSGRQRSKICEANHLQDRTQQIKTC
ncbi:hypothetical protein K474DRAFT_1110632 [Panus rudis PR-1116 ss-1]|nr:hypothetical protein K474DRAFT_1110632 [Panus rudis PR-1116 ss-1]